MNTAIGISNQPPAVLFNDTLEPEAVLTLCARGIPSLLQAWRKGDDDTGIFGSTEPVQFNMREIGTSSPVIEYVLRPHLQALCQFAAFHFTSQSSLIENILPGKELNDLLRKAVRWACLTHITGTMDVDSFLNRKRWGENWRSSLWAGMLGYATFLAGTALDEETRALAYRVVAFEADRFSGVMPPSGCDVDTKLEENAMDTAAIAWAINLCPDHPNCPQWRRSLDIWALNTATVYADKAVHDEYHGVSFARWISTCTMYPDYTAENHNFFHPRILAYSLWLVFSGAAFTFHGRAVPKALRSERHEKVVNVLLRFCLPNGMFFEPGGDDMPLFLSYPCAFIRGLQNNSCGAVRMTCRLLSWLAQVSDTSVHPHKHQWVQGFSHCREGWELLFQSQVGFELALLATLPFPRETRSFSSGRIEHAIDTRQLYPYIQLCYRRNTRTSRSIAWKAIGNHPMIGIAVHQQPALVAQYQMSLLGIPRAGRAVQSWDVLFHNDRYHKDGFESWGAIDYFDDTGNPVFHRQIRVVTWGDEGLVVLDRIIARQQTSIPGQYLSPLYIVNDVWTGNSVKLHAGSLRESIAAEDAVHYPIRCPSSWASINNNIVFQLFWGQVKGVVYFKSTQRNAPSYWRNCRLDILAVEVRKEAVDEGEELYCTGIYVGAGKGPRSFKWTGHAGDYFKGLVIMDGKNTIGID